MHTSNFDETLEQILQKDARYQRDAYLFVREALDHTQKMVAKATREGAKQEIRHVSGQELLEGVRVFALEQFGPMALVVFQEWGVQRCEDFGEIVFSLVESHLLAKTKNDTPEDFKGGYDFDDAFRKPFLPLAKKPVAAAIEPEPKSSEV
jgi:uncharacterized repeat protein (TIGR04138 family)